MCRNNVIGSEFHYKAVGRNHADEALKCCLSIHVLCTEVSHLYTYL